MASEVESWIASGARAQQRGDIAGAARMWRMAAAYGSADAMVAMSELARHTYEDVEEAIQWLRRAAQQGHVPAMEQYSRELQALGEADASRFWAERAAAERGPAPLRMSA